jgi:hypothetical protein
LKKARIFPFGLGLDFVADLGVTTGLEGVALIFVLIGCGREVELRLGGFCCGEGGRPVEYGRRELDGRWIFSLGFLNIKHYEKIL